ncbi:hypothetical protein, partial [Lysinibacillus sp. NPDC056232]|uniref:hypothetical protein n=1 Tax=Lysinibacillus sp. NPDC056232 TaxID=3345756 RepID=UPI0035E2F3B8
YIYNKIIYINGIYTLISRFKSLRRSINMSNMHVGDIIANIVSLGVFIIPIVVIAILIIYKIKRKGKNV